MSELENVSMDDLEGVWNHIKENPLLLGLPLSDKRGIDLLSALRDVYETMKTDVKAAQMLLTLLANVLVAATQGDGEEIVEEVMVSEAVLNMDQHIKELLDEGQ